MKVLYLVLAGSAFTGLGIWLVFKSDESRSRRHRRWAWSAASATFGLLLLSLGGVLYRADAADLDTAHERGFATIERYQAADRAGYQSNVEYTAHVDRQAAARAQVREADQASAVDTLRKQTIALAAENRERAAASDRAERLAVESRDKQCRFDAECFARENMLRAGYACAPLVADLSQTYSDWVNKREDPRFSHFKVKNLQAGVVTYIGDKIQFPNGAGGLANQVYECDYDAQNRRVVGVRARAGTLPR